MRKLYLSVEIGGTNLRYGVVDEDFNVLEFEKEPSKGLSEANDKGEFLEKLLMPYIEKYGKENIKAVALSLASLMNKERTINYNSPNIKGLDNISLTEIIKSRLSLPAVMERDVNTALLYEMRKGRVDNRGIVIGVFIGTGLGNAMCIDGKVYIGSSGSSCELGHIPVLGFDGQCGCGKKGCIELKASGNTLYELSVNKYDCPVSDIFEKYGDRDDVKNVIYACAIATATEITILDPKYVILGGGVVEMKGFPAEYFINTVKENLRTPYPRDSIEFVYASGDACAGIVGAAINAANVLNNN